MFLVRLFHGLLLFWSDLDGFSYDNLRAIFFVFYFIPPFDESRALVGDVYASFNNFRVQLRKIIVAFS